MEARAKYLNKSGAHYINNAEIFQTNPGVSDEDPQFEIFYGNDKTLTINADGDLCIYGASGLLGIVDSGDISKKAMAKVRNMIRACGNPFNE